MSADDTSAEFAQDAVLFARMRAMWAQVDPMPADLIDRMVAAIAVDDLSREYALLTLVETDLAAVRGDGDVLTLQFSDGTVTVLLHITRTEQSTHRIDGWVDAPPVSVAIVHGADEGKVRDASLGEHGRFEIDGIGAGLVRLRLTVRDDQGALHDMQTPQFEL
ncbi:MULTISPECIES: hypothetical protein [Microbacterium]|uniref:hypothetical protein n=1 Tax=Microbacterium TaxID=33882 RepID=UPI000DB6D298|nr:hypothetical protein [Microbacterium aurum]MCG7415441.1 hypothetical protein [Microbacterium aurum]PZU45108.1 MAG: hypothetical protein DI566_10860 [Microbacterium sp.]